MAYVQCQYVTIQICYIYYNVSYNSAFWVMCEILDRSAVLITKIRPFIWQRESATCRDMSLLYTVKESYHKTVTTTTNPVTTGAH